jgi:hypothetical protein
MYPTRMVSTAPDQRSEIEARDVVPSDDAILDCTLNAIHRLFVL